MDDEVAQDDGRSGVESIQGTRSQNSPSMQQNNQAITVMGWIKGSTGYSWGPRRKGF